MVATNLKDAEARIDVQEDEISIRVKKGEVIASINASPESVDINAARINLTGYVTATEFNAAVGDINELKAGDFTGVSMKCFTLAINSNYFTLGGSTISKQTYNIGGTDYKLLHWN